MSPQERAKLPVQDRPARPLRGARKWLSHRTMGDEAVMPIMPVITLDRRPEYIRTIQRRCAAAGHPVDYVVIDQPRMRICACAQICCEEPRP